MSKTCLKCNAEKRLSDYYPGRQHCKTCVLEVAAQRRQRDREAAESVSESDSTWGESLYILSNPRIPGELKVGRAACPTGQAQTLSNGQNFTLDINYTYAHRGYLEPTVHRRLAPWLVNEGPGREWFRLLPEQADVLVRAAILEHDLNSC